MRSCSAHSPTAAAPTAPCPGGRVDREVAQAVDFWHLIEKLGAAARLLDGDHTRHLARWRLRLLNVEHAARDILHELRASGREHVQVGEAAPVHDAITYLRQPPRQDELRRSPRRGTADRQRQHGSDVQDARRRPHEASRITLEHQDRSARRASPRARNERQMGRRDGAHAATASCPTTGVRTKLQRLQRKSPQASQTARRSSAASAKIPAQVRDIVDVSTKSIDSSAS